MIMSLLFHRQYLINEEASTVLCSVVKHTGSGRARKKCRVKHTTSCFYRCIDQNELHFN